MLRSFLAILALTAACGDLSQDAEYGEACLAAVPADLQPQIDKALAENTAARDAAVAAERARLSAAPLRPSSILGTTSRHDVPFKPAVDPYPESVVAFGDATYDVRMNGYELNHGMMDKVNVYETAPGSGEYFLVDMIQGDGVGGNGREVNAYTIEYGLVEAPATLDGFSWHSWHVSPENVLVRATQKPEDVILREIVLCGCGDRYEVEMDKGSFFKRSSDSAMAPASYQIAIFRLSGTGAPTLSSEAFEAKFVRSYVKKRYVPKKVSRCRERNDNVVC